MALASCEALDVADDGGFDAAERLGGWEALAAWAAGCQAREAADYLDARQGRVYQCPRDVEQEREAVAMELAAYARVAPRTGEVRLEQAHVLRHRLPRTLEALEAGRIALSHARVVIEQTEACTPEIARAVDTALWDRPEKERTPTQLRETVRRIVARLDPDSLRRRTAKARLEREVRYWADDDGATGVIQVRMPADEARGVFAVIDALAHTAADPAPSDLAPADLAPVEPGSPVEQRSLGNKRADVVRDLVLGALENPAPWSNCSGDGRGSCTNTGTTAEPGTQTAHRAATRDEPSTEPDRGPDSDTDGEPEPDCGPVDGPAAHPGPSRSVVPPGVGPCSCAGYREPERLRVQVRVTVPWRTLAGLGDDAADLEGHGPLPAHQARALAAGLAPGTDPIWQRLLTDPVTGAARHLDTTRYRPPAALAELVRARDRTCAAPGCRVPAARCDLDHVIPYDHTAASANGEGRTDEDNLRPGCRRHHRIKTHTGWTCAVIPDPTGARLQVLQWTSPTGRTWIVRPPELDDPWPDHADDPHQDRHEPAPDLPTPAVARPGIGLAAA